MSNTKNVISYKDRIKKLIEELPEQKLIETLDFLQYLKNKEEWEATWEILQDKEFLKGIKRGKRDIQKGRWRRWIEIRRNV